MISEKGERETEGEGNWGVAWKASCYVLWGGKRWPIGFPFAISAKLTTMTRKKEICEMDPIKHQQLFFSDPFLPSSTPPHEQKTTEREHQSIKGDILFCWVSWVVGWSAGNKRVRECFGRKQFEKLVVPLMPGQIWTDDEESHRPIRLLSHMGKKSNHKCQKGTEERRKKKKIVLSASDFLLFPRQQRGNKREGSCCCNFVGEHNRKDTNHT